jgi:hypothetical protein
MRVPGKARRQRAGGLVAALALPLPDVEFLTSRHIGILSPRLSFCASVLP